MPHSQYPNGEIRGQLMIPSPMDSDKEDKGSDKEDKGSDEDDK